MKRLQNKVALVTGASSGNGRAIAKRFAEEGASVTIADIQEQPRQAEMPTSELIAQTSGQAQFVKTDVTSLSDIKNAFEKTIERYDSLDIVVNNAGVPSNQPLESVTQEDYARVMDINLKGVYFGCQQASAVMRERAGSGSIVNVSSIAGLFGLEDSSLYCASKAAVANLTRQLAHELGQFGIRVNSVNPGFIETAMTEEDSATVGQYSPMVPLKRDGQTEEVANAVLFLASDAASYVNGHNLVVDGGLTAAISVPD